MRYVTTSAGRNLRVFEFFETPAMHRSVIFRNLVDPQGGIVLPHESRIGMAMAANLNHLNRIGFANISLASIHRFQAHLCAVAAVASDAAESLCRMRIGLVE